ncbi:putative DNA modification/repair radical SAM protein [Heliobacterium chlorum]|uniref:DNA modification/repair radical SAM protein n=1 Tax=Heliobacterium chlorum TaxID=2698 RepID=A0ABR7T4D9_HELCL|nr:putative DNA modification/repair radical SAM protein [Heliobacterium chlorum]MBC9785644.1 putative DNA modification/repair radical SAM protein [Heliobacterium chlorum]
MDLNTKLQILAAAAKYDVSCSSSGSNRGKAKGKLGNTASSGICHSWSDDGRCISLLKLLFTNDCCYDCSFCVNRVSNDMPRATFTPEELADLTINFYRRNYIEGLFLSSAISGNPDRTMEQLVQTVRILRERYRFNGYIHLKAIPGADRRLIEAAGSLVDRLSVNIELPTSEGLRRLAPQKKRENILKPMGQITSKIVENREERRQFRRTPTFVPAGQTTQLIVGATPETDLQIFHLAEGLYRKFQLKRVYYSAYVPVMRDPKLPAIPAPPLLREHRLYQADWLLRFYGFTAGEILDGSQPNLDLDVDPKTGWALRNLHSFPVEINRADYETLLRVPGIGVKSANRIITARRVRRIEFEHLAKMGIVLKRARYFITCNGKYYGQVSLDAANLRQRLILPQATKGLTSGWEQMSLFTEANDPAQVPLALPGVFSETQKGLLVPVLPSMEDKLALVTGEI